MPGPSCTWQVAISQKGRQQQRVRRELAGEGVEQTTQRDMAHKSGVARFNKLRFITVHYLRMYR